MKLKASLEAPIGSLIPEKDTQVIERPGWYQVITPSIKDASLNEVIRSLVPASEVNRRITEAFSTYESQGLPFKWCVGPMSAPEIEKTISPRALQLNL